MKEINGRLYLIDGIRITGETYFEDVSFTEFSATTYSLINLKASQSDIDYLTGTTLPSNYLQISLSGSTNGLATLDADGKVPLSQLPTSVMSYLGLWDASTNTPTISNSSGDVGDIYIVNTGGTIDLGSGSTTYSVGDWIIYNGTEWEKSSNTSSVTSVFGRTGIVVAQSGDYATFYPLISDIDYLTGTTLPATYIQRGEFNTYSAATDTLIGTKLNISDFNSYSATTDTLKLNVTDFNTYSATTKSEFDIYTGTTAPATYLTKSNFSVYSANTNTLIGTKLNISDFDTYSGATNILINLKTSQSDIDYLTGTTLPATYLTKSAFATYSANTNTLIGTKLNISDFNSYSATTNTLIGTKVDQSNIDYYTGTTAPNTYLLISLSGATNGLATLDSSGKIPTSQLPTSVMTYLGLWDANTNNPILTDGIGDSGDFYIVGTCGTIDLGSGSTTYITGDWVIYNGEKWEKNSYSSAITSVFGRTGVITAESTDYSAFYPLLSDIDYLTGTTLPATYLGKSAFATYSANTNTLIGTKLNISDFNSYSATTNTLIGTKLNISDFSSYSASTETLINTKANQSDLAYYTGTTAPATYLNSSSFATYSANTNTVIGTKLNISDFNSYSAATNTLIGMKSNQSDIDYLSGTTLPSVYLTISSFNNYSGNTITEINLKANQSDIDYLTGTTLPNSYLAISLSGTPNGLATLDSDGKIPVSQLSTSVMTYLGLWDANANNPTLIDGIGDSGDFYIVGTGGTIDLGSGSTTYITGDWIIYNGEKWEKNSFMNLVTSVFGRTGDITAESTDYSAFYPLLSDIDYYTGTTAQAIYLGKSSFATYSANTNTLIGTKLNITDFNSYSAATNTLITSKSNQSDISYYTGTTAPATYLGVSDFNTYSGSTNTLIGTKLNISDFNLYSGTTLTNIQSRALSTDIDYYTGTTAPSVYETITNINYLTGTTLPATYLTISNFNTYSATTNTLIGTKTNQSDITYYTGTTAPTTYLVISNFNTYSATTNTLIGTKLNISDFNSYSAYTATLIGEAVTQTSIDYYTGTTAPATYETITSINYLTGTTLPAVYLEISNFNSYSATTNTLINTKANQSDVSYYTGTTVPATYITIANFNTYSASTNTLIGTKVNTADFNTYSGATLTNIQSKALSTDIDYYTGTTAPAMYLERSLSGASNGLATLDSGGKIPVSQLPNSIMEYLGTWDASTNNPTLIDGTGNVGDVYIVGTGGTINLGSGSITFSDGDWIVYNGTTWEKVINSNSVASVFGRTGAVTADVSDYSSYYLQILNFNAYSATTNTLIGTKANQSDLLYYSGTTAPATYQTVASINYLTGTTLPTTYLDISNFNTYSASTNTLIGTKLNTSDFSTYSASTNTLIGTKLNTSDFSTYSASTNTLIGTKANQSDINFYTGTTAPVTYLGISNFDSYSGITNNLINLKSNQSDIDYYTGTTIPSIYQTITGIDYLTGTTLPVTYITTGSTNTLANKSFIDSTTYFVDDVDQTKRFQFQVSGIGAATTRIVTIPNSNGTIAYTTSSSFASLTTIDTLTSTHTLSIATAASASGIRKTINIGTGGASGSEANINLGITTSGTTTINTPKINLPSLTASQLLATDSSKNIQTLDTATYPSLTELSYVKGITSSIQTQLDSKKSQSDIDYYTGTTVPATYLSISNFNTYSATTNTLIGTKTNQSDLAYYTGTTAIGTFLQKSNNLSDLTSAAIARQNLDLANYSTPTFASVSLTGVSASSLIATNASSVIVSLSTATYPSLTELSYIKGVTSSIQTQLDSKASTSSIISGSSASGYVTYWDGTNSITGSSGFTYSGSNLTVIGNVYSNNLYPLANTTYSLGSNSFKWKDAYISNIYITSSGFQTITGSALDLNSINDTQSANFYPRTSATYSLGSTTKLWEIIYSRYSTATVGFYIGLSNQLLLNSLHTTARTQTFQDKDGTIALLSDIVSSSGVTYSDFDYYTGTTVPATYLSISNFNTYSATTNTLIGTKTNQSDIDYLTGTTLPATYLGISNFNIYSGSTNTLIGTKTSQSDINYYTGTTAPATYLAISNFNNYSAETVNNIYNITAATQYIFTPTATSMYIGDGGRSAVITGITGNFASGFGALESLVYGTYNTAVGNNSLNNSFNTINTSAFGSYSLYNLLNGSYNTSIGVSSGYYLTSGNSNIFIGAYAGMGINGTYKTNNTVVIGTNSGYRLQTGSNGNILIGYNAGQYITTGSTNIIIGTDVDAPNPSGSNQLNIGNTISGDMLTKRIVVNSLTASTLVATDSDNYLQSLSTSTYPTLTELSYVKGISSSIQTQLNGKVSQSDIAYYTGTTAPATYLLISNFDPYSASTNTLIGSKLNISDFNTYSATTNTLIGTKANQSDIAYYTGTTAPSTFLTIFNFDTYSGSTNTLIGTKTNQSDIDYLTGTTLTNYVTLTGTETLTNKTLTTPKIVSSFGKKIEDDNGYFQQQIIKVINASSGVSETFLTITLPTGATLNAGAYTLEFSALITDITGTNGSTSNSAAKYYRGYLVYTQGSSTSSTGQFRRTEEIESSSSTTDAATKDIGNITWNVSANSSSEHVATINILTTGSSAGSTLRCIFTINVMARGFTTFSIN